MTRPRVLFLFPLLVLLFAASSREVFAQQLPQKVKSHLDTSYPGWRLSAVTDGCGPDFNNAKVVGDFNGDNKTDYAVKFIRGRRGYIIAFVSSGPGYTPHVLESGSTLDIKNQGLAIARRGERYGEIINDNFDRVSRRLQNDAPVGGTCESSSYFYVYRNGTFKRAFTSD